MSRCQRCGKPAAGRRCSSCERDLSTRPSPVDLSAAADAGLWVITGDDSRYPMDEPLDPTRAERSTSTEGPSLVPCPDCRREVSRLAINCPGCGRPLLENRRALSAADTVRPQLKVGGGARSLGWVILILGFLVVMIGGPIGFLMIIIGILMVVIGGPRYV
jgi:hypothetical protein